MHKYRISKYNPALRDSSGNYQRDEWTAISDIGKIFNGVKLSDTAYIKTENSYIQAVRQIMELHSLFSVNVKRFKRSFSDKEFISLIEKYKHLYSSELLDFYRNFNGNSVNLEEISKLCRLQLREDVWSEIYYPRKLKIFIGYDYLMGIECSRPIDKIISHIESLGLYVECN